MTAEERFTKIEENLLVTSRMQIEAEGRWKEEAEQLRAAQKHTQKSLDLLIERQIITDTALHSLIASIDRFVQGRGGHGDSRQG